MSTYSSHSSNWEVEHVPFTLPVLSWFVSPLLSGIMSAVLFFLVRMFILSKVCILPKGNLVLVLQAGLFFWGGAGGGGGRR